MTALFQPVEHARLFARFFQVQNSASSRGQTRLTGRAELFVERGFYPTDRGEVQTGLSSSSGFTDSSMFFRISSASRRGVRQSSARG